MASSKEDIKSDLVSEAGSLDHRPAYIADVDNELYIPDLEFTPQEERRIVRSLDFRLFSWVLFTTFILNMDRTNHSNAVSDNLPEDLGFTINVVNTGVALYSAIFSCACIVGAVMAKIVGPHRCACILTGNKGWSLTECCRDRGKYVCMGSCNNGARARQGQSWIPHCTLLYVSFLLTQTPAILTLTMQLSRSPRAGPSQLH